MKERDIAILQARILQLQREKERLHLILSSRSWRLTAPLRFLKRKGEALRARWRTVPQQEQSEMIPPQRQGIARIATNWKANILMAPLFADGRRISLWTARKGNSFFHEIAHLLSCGLQDAGIPCASFAVDSLEECLQLEDASSAVRLIIAPHEFFHFIPDADLWPLNGARLWMLNSEQKHTPWFASARSHFDKADLILDMDSEMAEYLRSLGLAVEHVPLLYSPSCHMFDGLEHLPLTPAVEALPGSIRNWTCSADPLGEALAARPLDCCFFGVAGERRSRFFARNAVLFGKLQAYLRLEDRGVPLIYGENSTLSTEAVSSIVRRSKIALNIHQSEYRYFEWHRMILQGIWQGAVVVSEPCTASWPFLPDRDYVTATLEDMPAVLEYLLLSDEGRILAENVRRHAWQTLMAHPLAQCWEHIVSRYGFVEVQS